MPWLRPARNPLPALFYIPKTAPSNLADPARAVSQDVGTACTGVLAKRMCGWCTCKLARLRPAPTCRHSALGWAGQTGGPPVPADLRAANQI
jgi:hypothetical protein